MMRSGLAFTGSSQIRIGQGLHCGLQPVWRTAGGRDPAPQLQAQIDLQMF